MLLPHKTFSSQFSQGAQGEIILPRMDNFLIPERGRSIRIDCERLKNWRVKETLQSTGEFAKKEDLEQK